MQIEAYVSDGKGGCKKVLIEEPAESRAAREQAEFLRTLTPKTITDLTAALAATQADLAKTKAELESTKNRLSALEERA